MNKLAKRAWFALALAGVLLVGLLVIVVRYFKDSPDWVTFQNNPHVYNNGVMDSGTVVDRDGTVLFDATDGRSYADSETLRKAMDALRDKLFKNMPEEERIAEFVKAHEWGKQYPSADYYGWHHRLTGSCDMGRSEFAKRHGYKLTDDELLTVEEFIKLTENSYGGSVIRKLREAYEEEAT